MRTTAHRKLGIHGNALWRVLALATVLAPAALPQGQGMGGRTLPPMQGEAGSNGFGFYGLAGYFGYTSTAVPFNASLPIPSLNLGPNYLAGGSASVGWQKMAARTNAHVAYTLSYDASLRYSSWNSANHYLTLGVSHELTQRLSYYFSGTATTMRWDQYLFQPTVLSEVAQAPATFDELSSAILTGKYTNGQLASILTGSPMLESPAATLLYGTRFFTSSVRNTVTYDLSARLHIRGTAGALRTQHLASDTARNDGGFLVPSTTTATASVGLSYSLSPLTTIGIEAQGNRTFSRFEDAYITNGTLTASRVFGRHWVVDGRGGVGTFVPARQTFRFKPGPHYVAGGEVIYKMYSQSIMLEASHMIADTSGIGAQDANTASAVWQIHRPGQKWGVFSQARYTSLTSSSLSNVNAWLGGAGVERMIDRHTTIRAAYVYGRNAGIVQNILQNRKLQAVNLVISWTPHAMGL